MNDQSGYQRAVEDARREIGALIRRPEQDNDDRAYNAGVRNALIKLPLFQPAARSAPSYDAHLPWWQRTGGLTFEQHNARFTGIPNERVRVEDAPKRGALRDCECVPGHRCDCTDLRQLLTDILTNAEYPKMEAEGLAADALGLRWSEQDDCYVSDPVGTDEHANTCSAAWGNAPCDKPGECAELRAAGGRNDVAAIREFYSAPASSEEDASGRVAVWGDLTEAERDHWRAVAGNVKPEPGS